MESLTPIQMQKILLVVSLAFAVATFANAQDYNALDAFNYGLTHYGLIMPGSRIPTEGYCQPIERSENRTTEIRPDGMGNFYFYGSSGQRTGAAYTNGTGGYRINYFRGCDY